MAKLGVNIDHVATLRQARGEGLPNLVEAARICQKAGAHSIVTHLREDRRHIQDNDLWAIRKALSIRYNLEMSIVPNIMSVACSFRPDQATLVPERRRERTTESGLPLFDSSARLKNAILKLKRRGIEVSLFIDPGIRQVRRSYELGADAIEIHTGVYAKETKRSVSEGRRALDEIRKSADEARRLGMVAHAGHGLDYQNVRPIARIEGSTELNIGFSIIARSVQVGLEPAVKEMVRLVS